MLSVKLYYLIRPLIPRRLQLQLRRSLLRRKLPRYHAVWPILHTAGSAPSQWRGWPQGKRFALVLTHDVDTARGLSRCQELMRLEQDLGLVSSFNFVPEKRYRLPDALRSELIGNGFEVGVHGLNHDGKLFSTRRDFNQQFPRINEYIREWASVGFRAPAMHHNLSWLHDLDVVYDASTFDTDPFEPQPDGLETIFPAIVRRRHDGHEYIELPYTLPQDFTLYILLQEREPEIWKRKLAWLVERGGMVLMNTHPDYMRFDGGQPGLEEYRIEIYRDFLRHVQQTYAGQYWHALPREVASFVAQNRDKVTTVLTDQ